MWLIEQMVFLRVWSRVKSEHRHFVETKAITLESAGKAGRYNRTGHRKNKSEQNTFIQPILEKTIEMPWNTKCTADTSERTTMRDWRQQSDRLYNQRD